MTDGSEAGTRRITDLYPGSGDGFVDQLTRVGSRLFFLGRTDWYDTSLWVSDGTRAGTTRISVTSPDGQPLQVDTNGLFPVGNRVFFIVSDSTYTHHLWVTDSTAAGTRQVKDVAPGNGRIMNYRFSLAAALGETLIFSNAPAYTKGAAGATARVYLPLVQRR